MPNPIKPCAICRVEFQPKGPHNKTCGPPCRKRNQAILNSKWQKENRERHNARAKKFRDRNPNLESTRANAARCAGRRRALKFGSPCEPYTAKDLLDMLPDGCYICGSKEGRIGWDHVIPLSRGGADALHNIKPAHFKGCNAKKHAFLPEEWEARRAQLTSEGVPPSQDAA